MKLTREFKFITDYKKAVDNIREEIYNYLKENNLKSAVVGVSGGIDSALCCALIKPVCNKLNIPLIGRSISIVTNKFDEKYRANGIGNAFCDDFTNLDMSEEYFTLERSMLVQGENETEKQYKIRMGNVKARLRMITLYDLAQKNHGLVLSTDNFTEYLLGFWTINVMLVIME